MEAYRRTARERLHAERQALERRRRRAHELAREVAVLLREKYGATRIVLFGSLVQEGRFSRWSDVDLAVWGIPGARLFAAVAEVLALDPDIPVQLIDGDNCTGAILETIAREGVAL